jgi:hypothetical protein
MHQHRDPDLGVTEDERGFAARMGADPVALGRPAVGLLAAMQGGCVARWQLRWLGFAASTISRWVGHEGWPLVHTGVWRLAGVMDSGLSQVWAAVLAVAEQDGPALADDRLTPDADPLTVLSQVAADRVVVTGLSAANMRGLWRAPPPKPQLLAASSHTTERRGITLVHTTMPRFGDRWRHQGLMIASGPRMAWDVAWTCRRVVGFERQLADLVIRADRTRTMAVDDLVAVVDEPCRFGLPTRIPTLLTAAAELLRPGFSHSRTEAIGREIAAEEAAKLGHEVHPRPHKIRKDGRIIAEADIAVLSLRLDLEVDGPHHRELAQQARDRKRDGELATIDWAVGRHDVAVIDEDRPAYRRAVRRDLEQRIDQLP